MKKGVIFLGILLTSMVTLGGGGILLEELFQN